MVAVRGPLRAHRLAAPLVAGALVLVVSLALRLRDPHGAGSWGLCPWHAITGTWCPACGSLRAVNDLTHGDVGAALSSNLLFVLAIPVVAALWIRWTIDSWRGSTRIVDVARVRSLTVGGAAVLVVFWVVRNTTFGAWLAP